MLLTVYAVIFYFPLCGIHSALAARLRGAKPIEMTIVHEQDNVSFKIASSKLIKIRADNTRRFTHSSPSLFGNK